MENVNIYNNGHGWRISFPLGRVIQVLTVEEAMDLHGALESAIEYAEFASHQADPADEFPICPTCGGKLKISLSCIDCGWEETRS